MEKKVNINRSWDSTCILGFGAHAELKLLPALKEVGLNIGGVVSSKSDLKISGVKIFSQIEDAINFLPKNTLYIISSPPDMHYQQSKILVEAGKDIFIEKPAFTSINNLNDILTAAEKNNALVLEMLMYLESKVVKRIIKILKKNKSSVRNIQLKFLIPSIPKNTFRNESTLGCSLLSDMGCYPLSLLTYIGYDLSNLNLVSHQERQTKTIKFYIEGIFEHTSINIQIGLSNDYKNKVIIKFHDSHEIICEPFFYGRAGERKFIESNDNSVKEEIIYEKNSYELMFSRSRSDWMKVQKNRLDKLQQVTDAMQRLGKHAGFK
tara:strand:+ start:33301 stop:34263 length:963 start_codon:yes stop_codon:yes gene_type:complete